MKHPLICLTLLLLVGCSADVKLESGPTSTSNRTTLTHVSVLKDNYMYHNTVRLTDGSEIEFYHCESVGALEEGAVVDLSFDGDYRTMRDCAKNVVVHVIKSPTSTEDKVKLLLADQGYHDVIVYHNKGANIAIERERHFNACDYHWQATNKFLDSGVACEDAKGEMHIIRLDRM